MYFKVIYSREKKKHMCTSLDDINNCDIEPELFLPRISLVLTALAAHEMVIDSHMVVLLGILIIQENK